MNIICFYLDGTLLNGDEEIHPLDRSLLTTRSDIPFIITTGRAITGIKGVFTRNGLFKTGEINYPIVAQNGAVLYNKNEVFLEHNPFDPQIQHLVLNTIRIHTDITFFLFEKSDIYVMHENPLSSYYVQLWYMPVKPYDDSSSLSITKVMSLSMDSQRLQDIANSVSKFNIETSFSLDFLFELTPSGVDKGNGLQKLLRILNQNEAQIYIAGDGQNDLPIFNQAFRSYCPSTASEEVKSKADIIIDREKYGVLTPMLVDAGLF